MTTTKQNFDKECAELGMFYLALIEERITVESCSTAQLQRYLATAREALSRTKETDRGPVFMDVVMLLQTYIETKEMLQGSEAVPEMGNLVERAEQVIVTCAYNQFLLEYMVMGQRNVDKYDLHDLHDFIQVTQAASHQVTEPAMRDTLSGMLSLLVAAQAARHAAEAHPEMFGFKPKPGKEKDGIIATAIRDNLPDISVSVDVPTKDFINDVTQKLTELVDRTPLMQGKHKVGIDFGSFPDLTTLGSNEVTRVLLPTFLFVGGAASVYYLYKNPIKYAWVQKTATIVSSLISLMGMSAAGLEIYQQLCLGVAKAAELNRDPTLYMPGDDEFLSGRSRSASVEYDSTAAEFTTELGTDTVELIAVPILSWLHLSATERKPGISIIKDFVLKMKDTKDITESVHFSVEMLMKYVHFAIRYISDWAGLPQWEHAVHPYPALADLDIGLRELTRRLRMREIEPTKATALQVHRYEEQMVHILAGLKPGSNEFIAAKGIEAAIRELIKRHDHVWKKTDIRRRPYNITLTGYAGVGKSVLSQMITTDILPRLLEGVELYDYLQDPEAGIHYVNTNANFMDGFRHQSAIVIDDVGIIRDTGMGTVDEGILMSMRIDNDAPWTPDQASLANKESGYTMNNVLTVVNTNMMKINSVTHPSLEHPEAVRRRWNAHFVTIKREFSKGEQENIQLRRINPAACPVNDLFPDELSTTIWEFHPWDMERGARDPTKPVLNYDEFIAMSVEAARVQADFTRTYETTRHARKARVAELALEEKGLTMEDLLDERRVIEARNRFLAARRARVAEPAEAFVAELGDEPAPGELAVFKKRVELYLQDRYHDTVVTADDIWSKITTFRGVKLLDDVDKAMKPHLEKAYAGVMQGLETVKKTVRENPFLTALAVGAVVLTVGALFLPGEEKFFSHSGETKAQKEKRKPSKKQRVLARSLRSKGTLETGVTPEMGDHEANIVDLVCGNMFQYCICEDGRPVKSAWALGIAGTTIVMPLHYLADLNAYIEEHPGVVVTARLLSLKAGAEAMIFTRDSLFDCAVNLEHNELVGEEENQEDIVFLNLPNTMPRVRDIRTHMLSDADVLKFEPKGKGRFARIKRSLLGLEKYVSEVEYTRSTLPSYAERDIGVTNALFYAAATRAGDCGSPMFVKVGSDWKLAAFHTAGTRDKGSNAKGIGYMFSRTLVNPYVSNVGPTGLVVPLDLGPKQVQTVVFVDAELGGTKVLEIKKRHQNKETNIVRGHLFDVGEPTPKVPARLRAFRSAEGDWIDPMDKAREGYSGPAVVIGEPLRKISEAVFRFKANICGTTDGVLSIHDACFGVGDLNPITKNTSAGYPEKIVMPKGAKGKTWFLGRDGETTEALGYPTLVDMVEKARDTMLSGKPHIFLFEDNLKDEVVSKAKYDAGKTRLYSTGPLTLQVLSRMYFGKVMDLLGSKKNLFANWHAVGVNPYTDWPALHKLLNEFPKALEMDHEAFDKRETAEILFAAFEMLGKFYPDATPEDKIMRRLIAEAVVMSYHMNGDGVFRWVGSNPSGNPLTITLNDLVNQMLMIYVCLVWYLRKHSLTVEDCEWDDVDWDEIFAHIRLVTMGDDVLMTVGPIYDGITTKFFAETLAPLGYKITNADKSDPYTNPVAPKPLEETTFIKRTFKTVRGVMRGPLELASIRKSYHWMDKSLTVRQYAEIVQMALYEFALHGKDTWEKECPPLIKAMASKPLEVILEDVTFETCLRRTGTLLGFHN